LTSEMFKFTPHYFKHRIFRRATGLQQAVPSLQFSECRSHSLSWEGAKATQQEPVASSATCSRLFLLPDTHCRKAAGLQSQAIILLLSGYSY